MSEIIKGLPVDVPATEVHDLAVARARYHEDKAIFYRTQAETLDREERLHPDDVGQNRSMDAQGSLTTKAEEHAGNAKWLRFMAMHISPGATYRLADADLVTLGIKRNRY